MCHIRVTQYATDFIRKRSKKITWSIIFIVMTSCNEKRRKVQKIVLLTAISALIDNRRRQLLKKKQVKPQQQVLEVELDWYHQRSFGKYLKYQSQDTIITAMPTLEGYFHPFLKKKNNFTFYEN